LRISDDSRQKEKRMTAPVVGGPTTGQLLQSDSSQQCFGVTAGEGVFCPVRSTTSMSSVVTPADFVPNPTANGYVICYKNSRLKDVKIKVYRATLKR